ncbi:MAG: hypothetical protein HY240_06565 [Actinobacteria bacterium]|nr:hypothetical protein [Actinomycetota bacterium]
MSAMDKTGGLRRRRGWIAGAALVCVAVAAGSVWLQQRALAQGRADAENRAATYADQVVSPPLADRIISGPIEGGAAAELSTALNKEVFATNKAVEVIRIWSPTGDLLFSSDDGDKLGPNKLADQSAIRAAVKGDGKVTSSVARDVLSSYVWLRVGGKTVGAVEVDTNQTMIEAAARQPWTMVRTVAAGLAGFFLLLTLVSFIPFGRRAAKRARGKAFQQDEAFGGSPTKELDRTRAKLEKAEQGRAALEVELGQLRTQIATASEGAERRVAQLEKALELADQQLKRAQASPATAALDAKIGALESALAGAKAHAAEVEARVSDMASRSTENQTIAQRSQEEAEAARAQLALVEARAAQAEAKIEELERKLTDVELAKSELKDRNAQVEEELRWTRAQQTESQPILQEAAVRSQEEKARAEEMLERATRAEARFADADARAARAEQRAAEAEQRAAAVEAPGGLLQASGASAETGSDERVRALEEELAAARREEVDLRAELGDVSSRLEQMEARVKRAYAEAEAAQAQLSLAGERGQVSADAGEVVSLRTEADRLGTELARTLERAHAAEERGARLEAELVALHKGMQLGEGPPPSVPNGWANSQSPLDPAANGSSTPEAESAGVEALDGEPVGGDLADEGPSLRARLAATAARKKGRTRQDGGGSPT